MATRNTFQSYGSIAKFFHWTVALLIIGLLIIGFLMVEADSIPFKAQVYNWHKLLGLIVLLFVILRLVWRLINPAPELPLSTPFWERLLAKVLIFLFYICIIAMPVSGWISSSAAGYFPHLGNMVFHAPFVPHNDQLALRFFQIHKFLAWTIISLIVLHLAGVLKHHFLNKDNVLLRMLPGKNYGNGENERTK